MIQKRTLRPGSPRFFLQLQRGLSLMQTPYAQIEEALKKQLRNIAGERVLRLTPTHAVADTASDPTNRRGFLSLKVR